MPSLSGCAGAEAVRVWDVRISVGLSSARPGPAAAAKADLWTELHSRMRAFVGRRISDQHAADDVAQEVVLRIHRHVLQLRAEDQLDAMACTIARNAITVS